MDKLTKKVENGKIEQLESVLKAMTRKVLSLERELVEIKRGLVKTAILKIKKIRQKRKYQKKTVI